jgi:1,4-alpha-glucan branching enzyme
MLGSFTFILHTHLPYVLHHGKWPHGSDWLSEAAAECYIPILGVFERLQAEGLTPKISMDFSPIDLEQLADPDFATVFLEYCHEKIEAAEKDYLYFAQQGEHHLQPLAEYWREFYSTTKKLFVEKYQCNIVSGFRRLSDSGALDAMTCGATHGYFPLLLRDDNIRGQINCAIETHEQHFGKRPRGIWLPECGYRPRYNWSPMVGPESFRYSREERAGVEELVAEAGLEYFVVDGALTKGGTPIPPYQPFARALHEKYIAEIGPNGEPAFKYDPTRSLTDIYWVDSTNSTGAPAQNMPAIFSRDTVSAARVWDAEKGYPGAGAYLDFSKKHHNSGLRYWKVTGAKIDMGDKQQYHPEETEFQLDLDADDFVSLVSGELANHANTHRYPGILAAPFDTELFGHWWYEGPRFLEKVMRRMAASEIKLTNCAEAIDNYSAPHKTISLPEGSWGEGGHHFVWTNKEVAWMWDIIYPLEDRFLKVLDSKIWGDIPVLSHIMKQAARELLLLEASDWPFVISTQGAIEYSKMRFGEHAEILTRLLDIAENFDAAKGLDEGDSDFLREVKSIDRPFPIIDLHWWQKKQKPDPIGSSTLAS